MSRSLSLTIVCALALAAVACGGSSTAAAPSTAPAPTAGTEAFTGTMARGGAAIRNFTASAAGTASVTMLTTDPGGTLLGLGIGIPGTNAGSCDMTTTIQTRAGSAPQLTATVEPGTFCAGVFDIGTIGASGVVVGMTVAHP